MIEALAFKLLRQALPVGLGRLKQAQRTHHVGLCKGKGVFDGTVHVAFGSKVDDAVHLLFLHQAQHALKVADVHLHKAVVRLVLNVFEVSQVASVGQLVEVDDFVLRVFVHKQAHHMAANKTGSTGNDDVIHNCY